MGKPATHITFTRSEWAHCTVNGRHCGPICRWIRRIRRALSGDKSWHIVIKGGRQWDSRSRSHARR